MAVESQLLQNNNISIGSADSSFRDIAGQRLTVTDRTLTNFTFKLARVGSPNGTLTFRIYSIGAYPGTLLYQETWMAESALTVTPTDYTLTFAVPQYLNQEVRIVLHSSNGAGVGNYTIIYYQTTDVKANEYLCFNDTTPTGVWDGPGGVEGPANGDLYYSYSYSSGDIFPDVTTVAASSISGSQATLNGTVDAIHDSSITGRGFVWDTVSRSNPGNVAPSASAYSTNWSETSGPYSLGAFSHVAGLAPGTTYYFRAAAQNDLGNWTYGEELSFSTTGTAPAVTTNAASSVLTNAATLNGDVTAINDTSIVARAFVWDTVSRANPGNTPASLTDYSSFSFMPGSWGTGAFSDIAAGLTGGTTYYFRAAARNNDGEWAYGSELSFATIAGPEVDTHSVDAAFPTSTLRGLVKQFNDASISDRGFVWDTVSRANPGNTAPAATDYANNWSEAVATALNVIFTHGITVANNTTYYFRACAKNNSLAWGYGPELTFSIAEVVNLTGSGFGYDPFDPTPSINDFSADILSLHIERGREHGLGKVETGTATIVLKNTSGDYWRLNAAGSYYPNLKPLNLIRLQNTYSVTTYPLFYGLIESFKAGWRSERGGLVPTMQLDCVDIFKSLSRLQMYALPGSMGGGVDNVAALKANANATDTTISIKSLVDSDTQGCDIRFLHVGQSITIKDSLNSEVRVISAINTGTYVLTLTAGLTNNYTTANNACIKKFPSALSGVRVTDISAELDWPTALNDIDAGVVTIAELVPDAGGKQALEHLHEVVEAEDGVAFIAADGKFTFHDQDHRIGASVTAIFSADGNDNKYSLPDIVDDDTYIYNEAVIDGAAITGQLYRDVSSQATQGRRIISRTGSVIASDTDAFAQAYALVERYKDSVQRVQRLLVEPDRDAANLYPIVLNAEISDLINFELNTSPNLAGIDIDMHIEGITHDWESGGIWQTKLQLWDVNLFRMFTATHTGDFQKESAVSYADAHDAANADAVTNDTASIRVGQRNQFDPADHWYVWRGYLEFNTASIGAGATIESAELVMIVNGGSKIDTAWNLTLVPATDVTQGGALVVADYGDMLDDTTSYGTVSIPTPRVNQSIAVITLNAAGIAAINKTGTTSFGLRSSLDISNTGPAAGAENLQNISIKGYGSSPKPFLAVKLHNAGG